MAYKVKVSLMNGESFTVESHRDEQEATVAARNVIAVLGASGGNDWFDIRGGHARARDVSAVYIENTDPPQGW
jgi:hypothetical protein